MKTMPEAMPSNNGIALNVARTRVTVLVFNLTIISFMFSILAANHSADSGLSQLSTSVALFMGFCLTLLGLWLLLFSQNWDEVGLSRPVPFTLGAMTVYLALSQTITAFMHGYLLGVMSEVKASRLTSLDSSGAFIGYDALGETPLLMLAGMGAAIWVLITYIGPLIVLLKSPLRGGFRWLLGGYYFALQIPIYWVYSKAWHLEYVPADQSVDILTLFALQFVQPLLWFH